MGYAQGARGSASKSETSTGRDVRSRGIYARVFRVLLYSDCLRIWCDVYGLLRGEALRVRA